MCGKAKKCSGWQMGKMGATPKHCALIENGTLLDQGGSNLIASVAKESSGGGGGGGGYMSAHFGEWYSHPKMGECTNGHSVGDGSGCTWRAVGNRGC
jgi:hypothetical protein